jgi:hypothetical protein
MMEAIDVLKGVGAIFYLLIFIQLTPLS